MHIFYFVFTFVHFVNIQTRVIALHAAEFCQFCCVCHLVE